MQIVIELPEEDYLRLKEKGMFGKVDVFKRAIRNSTPLPKGHGRLIDADKIIHYQIYDAFHQEYIVREKTIRDYLEIASDEGYPETIIEADRGRE